MRENMIVRNSTMLWLFSMMALPLLWDASPARNCNLWGNLRFPFIRWSSVSNRLPCIKIMCKDNANEMEWYSNCCSRFLEVCPQTICSRSNRRAKKKLPSISNELRSDISGQRMNVLVSAPCSEYWRCSPYIRLFMFGCYVIDVHLIDEFVSRLVKQKVAIAIMTI